MVIKTNIIRPTMLTPFFKSMVQPITVSRASDKKSPIMGIKLSTVNFAVFAITPSTLDVAIPCMVITPVNTVSMIPNKAMAMVLIKSASFETRILSDILLIIERIEEKITMGITIFFIKVAMTVKEVKTIGCIKEDEVIPPIERSSVISTGSSDCMEVTIRFIVSIHVLLIMLKLCIANIITII